MTTPADIQAQLAALAARVPGGTPFTPPAYPSMMPAPPLGTPPAAVPVGEDRMRQMIAEEFQKHMPGVAQRLQAFGAIFAKALPPEDYSAFYQYVADGAPGLQQMVDAGKFDPIVQLLWETIKEGKK